MSPSPGVTHQVVHALFGALHDFLAPEGIARVLSSVEERELLWSPTGAQPLRIDLNELFQPL